MELYSKEWIQKKAEEREAESKARVTRVLERAVVAERKKGEG